MVQNLGVAASCQEEGQISRDDLNRYNHFADENFTRLQKIEKKLDEVEHFYQSSDVQVNDSKNKGVEKYPFTSKRPPLHRASSKKITASEEMQEINRHFYKIFHELTQHEWAWPFMEPVDVKGLKLDDYYEYIKKPMDFTTIKRKMDASDGSGYKNVREMYADVKLIFTNAMTYNDKVHDVYQMAKTLLEKFEKKWQKLLPKIYKAESALEREKEIAEEANYYEKTTKQLGVALSEVEKNLQNLKAMMIGKCRKLSTRERIKLGENLARLSQEDLSKALRIVCENDPNFKPETQLLDVDLDLNSQSDYVVWRLNYFAIDALQKKAQDKTEGDPAVNHNNNIITEDSETQNSKAKRRRLL